MAESAIDRGPQQQFGNVSSLKWNRNTSVFAYFASQQD
jgi:hypothetical protein